MAEPLSLGAPTLDEIERTKPNLLFLDPRKPEQKGPDAIVPQADVTAQVELQPARLTGLGIDPETGEKKDLTEIYEEQYGGATIGGQIAIAANEFLDNSIGGINRGINDFIVGIPDAALNQVDNALTAAGIIDKDTIDQDFLKRLFQSDDFEAQKIIIPYLLQYGAGERIGSTDKDSIIERYGRSAGENIAIAVPFLAMQAKLAQLVNLTAAPAYQAARTGVKTVADKVAPYLDRIVAPFRTSPGTATAIELGGAGLAGVGMQAEEEVFGTNTGIGGLVGVGAPFYLGTKVTPKIKTAFTWFGRPALTAIDDAALATGIRSPGGGKAQSQLETQVSIAKGTDQGAANWQRAEEIETKLGPFAPDDQPIVLTPGEKTLDPPFLATQARLEGKGDAEFTRQNLSRKFNVLESIANFKNYLIKGKGDPTLDAPLYIYDEATNSYVSTVGKLDAEKGDLAFQLDTLSHQTDGAFPLMTDKAATGEQVRQSIIAAKEVAKDSAEKLATKLKINQADQLASNDALVKAQESLKKQVLTRQGEEALSFKGLHPIVKDFLNTKLKRISFQDWKNFSSQTSDALGKAVANNKSEDIRTLAILKKTLDNMGTSYGRTSEKFQQFQTVWRETVLEPFSNSFVSKVIDGPGGKRGYTLAPEKVAKAFLSDSNAAKTYMSLFADDPDKMRFMKNAVLDAVRKAGIGPKGLNADKINTHLNTNRDIYTELGLFDELSNSNQLVSDVLARQAELATRTKLVNSNLLFKSIAKSMNNSNPQSLFDDAIRNPTIMKELKQIAAKGSDSLSPEESLYVFRAAITDRLFKNYAGTDVLANPKAFKQMIVDNEIALNQAFDKDHLNNIYLIADAAERIMATGLPKGAGTTTDDIITALSAKMGTSPAGISNRFIAVQEGRLGPRAAIGYIASRFLRQQSSARTEMLFKEMMFNPQVAKDLTATGTKNLSISEPVRNRLNTYLFNVGVEAIGAKPDVDPDTTREIIFKAPENEQSFVSPEILPPVNTNQVANLPINNVPPPAPVANVQQPNIQTASATDLFPFDPTLAAIEKRQNAKQGIMSLT